MTPSDRCLDLITGFEKLRLTAYLPTPDDVWTIGYGHTHNVKEGDTCTKEQARKWLFDDVEDAALAVDTMVKQPLTQNQFDALVSFVFNIGDTAFHTSTMLRDLNDAEYAAAAEQFPRWNKQKGKVKLGLTRRRAAERALFEEK